MFPCCPLASQLLRRIACTALAALCFAGVTAQVAAAKTVRAPKRIDASGKTDASRKLNRWLNSLPAGTTAVLSLKGRYRLDSPVVIVESSALTLNANGAVFTAKQLRNRSVFTIVGGEHIRVLGLRIVAPRAGDAVTILGTDDVQISNCTLQNVRGNAVTIANNDGDQVNGATVSGCRIDNVGGHGFSVVANHASVDNNTITRVGKSAFDVSPSAANRTAANIAITNNRVGSFGADLLRSRGLGGTDTVHDIVLSGNVLTSGSSVRVSAGSDDGARRSNYFILNNTGGAPTTGTLIHLENIDGIKVLGNDVSTTLAPAVLIRNGCHVNVYGNDFLDSNGVPTREYDVWGDEPAAATNTFTPYAERFCPSAANVV